MLSIPLAVGGRELIPYTKGIGWVEGYFLKVEIRPWMAEKLGVGEGTIMAVDNLTGEFRMQRYVESEPNQSSEPTARSGFGAA